MPGFDRTGPRGDGPMTGGGFGHCGSGKRLRFKGLGVGQGGAPRGGGAGRCWGGGRSRWHLGRGLEENESYATDVEISFQKLADEVRKLKEQISNLAEQSSQKDKEK